MAQKAVKQTVDQRTKKLREARAATLAKHVAQKAVKQVVDQRTKELQEARAATQAELVAQKAAKENEAFKAKACDERRQLIAKAELRRAAGHAQALKQTHSALKDLELLEEREVEAAVAKDRKDRETAAVVHGFQAAWKDRSKQQKVERFKEATAKMKLEKERDLASRNPCLLGLAESTDAQSQVHIESHTSRPHHSI